MSLRHGILGLIAYHPQSGWDIVKFFKESQNLLWPTQASQIYRELAALEKAAWITPVLITQDKRPNKKVYHLSESGRWGLERWLVGFDPLGDTQERSALVMRVFLGGCLPIEATRRLLEIYRKGCQTELSEIGNQVPAPAPLGPGRAGGENLFWDLTVEHGRRILACKIAWVDSCLEKIRECS